MHVISVKKRRPDFRVFIDLLFGPDREVDSDGDAHEVYSRQWRDLYLRDRETNSPSLR